MGSDVVVGGVAGLYVCVLAVVESAGQYGGDTVVFLDFDAVGSARFGFPLSTFAMVGSSLGGVHVARFVRLGSRGA